MNKVTEENLKKSAERLGVRVEQIPRHIAIIMDGNGRWAEKKGLPRAQGHRQGGEIVEKIALYCVEVGIECLTLYSFSMENWKRPKEEVDALMYIYTLYLVQIRSILMKNNVKLIHLGRVNPLPVEVQKELFKTIEETSVNTGMTLAIALNYGGRTEIIDATRKIAEEYKEGKITLEDIDERCIDRHLYTAGLPEPDLLIRTANESRISNFLLWQISYSEFYVTKTLWPSFKKTDLDKAILAYARRDRRFGAVKPRTETS
ncbi:MAG: isoprenyl transferase [Planctomycetota bacterium]|nr:isoprenyl transferase [Planctomycetota bacterium]